MNTWIGALGHLFVITAFVFSIVTLFNYWKSTQTTDSLISQQWTAFARKTFLVHGLAVFGIVATLFFIISQHLYEYHYAWSHSSNLLPVYYMISCFWEGQEGSFLLWIFWHVLIGMVLVRKAGTWEAGTMMVFSAVQAFLLSMILGLSLFDLKIGSSPFILLRDALDAPIFLSNPSYIPEDGTGLNPLLQNYWMVIHPPTLFLGFALMLVPFAYCLAGIQSGQYKEWIKPALPWAHLAALVLGVGIVMGAYWAYETLNFGGYWNWDPVENAVYIPWLILVAAIHLMIVYQRNGSALRAAIILIIAAFVLVLYSTFLTRSGVLGEASVHSFTDLGLSGQLLIYLLAFAVYAVLLLVKNWRQIPATEKEVTVYTREFWIFLGATILCLAGFQVLIPTSIPVYNAFLGFFGVSSNLAPPADQVIFYTKFQLWFAVFIALFSGTGQFFWWNKITPDRLKAVFTFPVAVSLIISAIVIAAGSIHNWKYIIVLTASIYAVVANGAIIVKLAKMKVSLVGGAVAHFGIALMLIGILFSAGYSKTISLNMSGKPWHSDFSEEMNKENLLLFRNEPRKMGEYVLTYKGPYLDADQVPEYVEKYKLFPTNQPHLKIAREDLAIGGKTYAKRGDTVEVAFENTYYLIEYAHANGEVFRLFPRIQNNAQMGYVPSPDIQSFVDKDLYTHITNLAVDDEEAEWSKLDTLRMQIGDTVIIHDYFAILDNVTREENLVETELNADNGDVAVKAHLRILSKERSVEVEPLFIIKDKIVGLYPATHRDLGIKIQLSRILPETSTFEFGVQTSQKDWVILNAMEKPFINLLWIGTLVMAIGFGIAVNRRYRDYQERDKKPSKKSAAKKTAKV